MTRGTTSSEIARQANAFWQLVGDIEPYPRTLESAVLWALPLGIVKLPRLGLTSMRSWLLKRGIAVYANMPDRPLHGCLIARRGQGFVFLDGCDDEDDRRFSLSHEVAHFLRDYLWPRQHVLATLGEGIVDVLDGLREPTIDERVAGVFRGARLGTFMHLLDRKPDGFASRLEVIEAEDGADRLAVELLAPRVEATARLAAAGLPWRSTEAPHKAATILSREFGLPRCVAERYGHVLVLARRPPQTFREWLKS
jgi:hypothetical protein